MPESLYPIFLDLTGKSVLVVGGGSVAARKVATLLESGVRVTVVALELCGNLQTQVGNGLLTVHRRAYRSDDLAGQWLVIAATDDAQFNQRVFTEATQVRLFCNVVDQPRWCSFQVPAVVRRGLLQIAISTGGASPALAARIRRQLEEQFGPAYAELLDGLMDLRRCFQEKYPQEQPQRQQLLESFLDCPAVRALLTEGDSKSFAAELEQWKSK